MYLEKELIYSPQEQIYNRIPLTLHSCLQGYLCFSLKPEVSPQLMTNTLKMFLDSMFAKKTHINILNNPTLRAKLNLAKNGKLLWFHKKLNINHDEKAEQIKETRYQWPVIVNWLSLLGEGQG